LSITASDTQGRARQGSAASQERRLYRSGTKGAVHRDEETVGSKKEGGRWHWQSERLSESPIQSLSVIEGLSQV
jgi:hypothetical protein